MLKHNTPLKSYLWSSIGLLLVIWTLYSSHSSLLPVVWPLILVQLVLIGRAYLLSRWDGPHGELDDVDERATDISNQAARISLSLALFALLAYVVFQPKWNPYASALWFMVTILVVYAVAELVLRRSV